MLETLDISKKYQKSREKQKVLRMKQPIVENVATPRESILTLSRGSQLPYTSKKMFADFC